MIVIFARLCGTGVHPSGQRYRHARPGPLSDAADILGCPVFMNHQNTKSIFTVPGSFNERPNQPPPSSNQSSRATSPFRRLSTPEYNETLSAVNRAPVPTSTKPTSNPSSAVKETNHEPVTRDPVPASGTSNSRGRSLSHPTAIPKEFVKPAPRQPSIARPPTTTVVCLLFQHLRFELPCAIAPRSCLLTICSIDSPKPQEACCPFIHCGIIR